MASSRAPRPLVSSLFLVVFLAFALVFFGRVPPAFADPSVVLAERLVQLVEQVATIVQANRNNCDAMGDKLNTLVDANLDFLRDAKKQSDSLTPDEKRALEARFKTRTDAAVLKMRDGLMKCLTNPKVQAAVAKIRT